MEQRRGADRSLWTSRNSPPPSSPPSFPCSPYAPRATAYALCVLRSSLRTPCRRPVIPRADAREAGARLGHLAFRPARGYRPALLMPGQPRTRQIASRRKRITNDARKARSVAYAELVRDAAELGVERPTGTTAGAVLQEVLDRTVGHYRYAASEVDKLTLQEFWVHGVDDVGNTIVEPNKWYKLESELRAEIVRLASRMEDLGLAERQVQLEEARAALVVAAIRDAAREAGLNQAQMRKLGQGLRSRLEAAQEAV